MWKKKDPKQKRNGFLKSSARNYAHIQNLCFNCTKRPNQKIKNKLKENIKSIKTFLKKETQHEKFLMIFVNYKFYVNRKEILDDAFFVLCR